MENKDQNAAVEALTSIARSNDRILEYVYEINRRLSEPLPETVFYSSKQAAEVLNITTRTLLSYRQEGRLKFIRINKKVLFLKDYIDHLKGIKPKKESKSH